MIYANICRRVRDTLRFSFRPQIDTISERNYVIFNFFLILASSVNNPHFFFLKNYLEIFTIIYESYKT